MTDTVPDPDAFDLEGLSIPAADDTPDPDGPTDMSDAGPGDAGSVDLPAGDDLPNDPELDDPATRGVSA